MIKNSEKKLAFWGCGDICKQFLRLYPETRPDIIIDSFSNENTINGINIVRPDSVDLKLFFIVIMMVKYSPVEKILIEKGLVWGEDYCDFETFVNDFKINASLTKKIANDVKLRLNHIDVVLYAPIFYMRNSEMMINFVKNIFSKERRNIVLLCNLGVYSQKLAEKLIGGNVIPIPYCYIEKDSKSIENYETLYLKYIENGGQDMGLSSDNLGKMSAFWDEILNILQPKEILLWGSRTLGDVFCLENHAINHSIKYGFLEHGLIPGTILMDPCGVTFDSIYTINAMYFSNREISAEKINNAGKVISYIFNNRLDTVNSKSNNIDMYNLGTVDNKKKTVLYLGSLRDLYNTINRQYWNKNVSALYTTDTEMVDLLFDICNKNNLNLIFKPHPGFRGQNVCKKAGLMYVEDTPVDELIDLADVVVTGASAVEYIACIRNKPVVQVTSSTMNGKGCTYKADNKEELEKMLLEALKYGYTDSQRSNFERLVACLLDEFMWDNECHKDFPYGRKYNGFFEPISE